MSTLRSLAGSNIPAGLLWEVLVVDNNSTDCTPSIVAEFIAQQNSPFRYLFEQRQGKAFALNTGVCEAHGKIIAMTDDDCIVDPEWISLIVKEYRSDPKLMILGGRVELYNQLDEPMTTRLSMRRVNVSLSPFEPCSPPIIGCNVAYRREIFGSVGYFDHLLGPGTKRSLVAEDVDFLYRVYKRGFKIIYSPDILVYHNHGRRTDVQWVQVSRNYLHGRGAFYCKYILRADREIFKRAYWEVVGLVNETVKGVSRGEWPSRSLSCLRDLFRGALFRVFEEIQFLVTSSAILLFSRPKHRSTTLG